MTPHTALYYANGTAFGAPLAEPRLPSEDLRAIAARAMDQRELHGDEAYELGEGYELLAGQLDVERNAHQATMFELDVLRRQLTEARDELLLARLGPATEQVSYADHVDEWRQRDAAAGRSMSEVVSEFRDLDAFDEDATEEIYDSDAVAEVRNRG